MIEAPPFSKSSTEPHPVTGNSSPMIKVRSLTKRIGQQEILRGVDLEVRTGETLAIIGRSGGGKTVLLKHMIGLMEPDAGENLGPGPKHYRTERAPTGRDSRKGGNSFPRRRAFRFHDGGRQHRFSFA